MRSGWMVQLVGDSGSGKSTLVQFCADLAGKRLRQISLSSATDVTDLLGAFEQFNYRHMVESEFEQLYVLVRAKMNQTESDFPFIEIFDRLKSADGLDTNRLAQLTKLLTSAGLADRDIEHVIESLENIVVKRNTPARGSFHWVDSELVNAIRYGDWIVLDNTNQSSDALLDRLNGLLDRV